MNPGGTKEFMKLNYPDLDDFDNLQFVKDCAEEGVKKYKETVVRVALEKVFGRARKQFEQIGYIYTRKMWNLIERELERELGLNGGE